MMRLAINGRFLSQKTTGVQRVAREFVRALDRLLAEGALPGVAVRLLVQPDAAFGDIALRAIRVEVLKGGRGHIWEQFVLPRHVAGERLLNLGNTAPLVSLLGRRPVAVMLHDVSERVFPGAYRLHYRLAHRLLNLVLMHRADPIITVAETERATIGRLYPRAPRRVVVAPNGGWRDDMPAPPAPHGARGGYGLYVGSLSRRKNIEGVIETAVALARERGLRFKIVGSQDSILARARFDLPEDVRDAIEYCGQIEDGEALRQVYAGAAFLLFPSFYEASALPPMEAMALGCPVVVADIPSLVERCGQAALYCDPWDPASILASARRVLDEPELARDLARRGIEHARSFSWRAQALRIVAALDAGHPGALAGDAGLAHSPLRKDDQPMRRIP